MTHTYAILKVSPPTYNEVARRMQQAGHNNVFHEGKGKHPVIDMHGIALEPDVEIKPGEASFFAGSVLSSRTKQGLVQMQLNDAVVQLDLDKAREVIQMLQTAVEAAISDQLFIQFLTTRMELPPTSAAAALGDFREMRQGSKSIVLPQ